MSTAPPGCRRPDQVARLLALVPYLHTRDEVRGRGGGRRPSAPPALLLRDLRLLFMCGLPGGHPTA